MHRMFYIHKSYEDSYVSKIPSKIPTSSILKIYSYTQSNHSYVTSKLFRKGEVTFFKWPESLKNASHCPPFVVIIITNKGNWCFTQISSYKIS